MGLLLYEDLPLRTAQQMGDFADATPLAHVYGDLTQARFPLVRVNATRGHAADHPMEITGAGTGDRATDSWEAHVEPDATGQVCTFVDFGAPVPNDQQMWAYGRGKRNQQTGALIENPGEWMADVAAIAGRTDLFQIAREECSAAGIKLAGRVADVRSIRAWLDEVAGSAGVIWAPGMSRRYPLDTVSGGVIELDRYHANLESDVASPPAEDTADVLRVAYDWCDASGKPRKYVELTASPQRFGGLVKLVELKLLRSATNAIAVGTQILRRLAAVRYVAKLTSIRTDIRPGHWLRLTDHPQWPFSDVDPLLMTLAVTIRPSLNAIEIDAETIASEPTVTVTAHSIALDDLSGAALEVSTRNGIVTFTVYDEDHRGIAGAKVQFDGGIPKLTDASGQVSFTYQTGAHEIAIEAPGRLPETLSVVL